MAQNSLIQVRVDDEVKMQADKLFSTLGIDTPTAIRMFLKQSIMRHGIPFAVTTVDDFHNSYNLKALEASAKNMEKKHNVIVKTIAELEALEDE